MKSVHKRVLPCVTSWLLLLTFATSGLPQQSPGIQYVYDALGRLIKVIDQNGEGAEYVYDAVGNILAIRRFSVAELALLSFTPTQGAVGTTVTLQGRGFSTVPGENTVTLNEVTALVLSATTTSLAVQVPADATTGPIAITVASQTALSDTPFTVLPAPVISSITPTLLLSDTETPTLQVQGEALTDARFTFMSGSGFAVFVADATINRAGTSATLQLTIPTQASGVFVLIARRDSVRSDDTPTAANTLQILQGDADDDRDGVSNRIELSRGLDPFNPDSDADGWPDEAELTAGSDPLAPASIPLGVWVAQPAALLIRPVPGMSEGSPVNVTAAQPPLLLLRPVSGAGEPDSDGDGWSDQAEQDAGSDPENPASQPRRVVAAQPLVLLSRPLTIMPDSSTATTTVAQPVVLLSRPLTPTPDDVPASITVARPPVTLEIPPANP